ncbi:MAG: GNAT family N-acetyltransferase [Thermoproteota archaeon]
MTPANIRELLPSASSNFIKRIETAPVYAYADEKGKLVAMSGVGFLTKRSFAISYTETEPEYRGRGIAKCLTSLSSEALIKKGLVGVYSADVTNEPSLGVAEGLGFLPYKDLKCFYK